MHSLYTFVHTSWDTVSIYAPLQWLYCIKEPEGQVARWLEKLQEFDFEVTHRRGLRHVNADALSRLPCTQCGISEEGENDNDVLHVAALQLSGLHIDDVLQKQSEDQEWKCLIEAKKSNSRPAPLPDQDGKSMEIRRL